jgi:hypothetical protein
MGAGYLVNTTRIIAIQYKLERRALFGNAKLGFLGLDTDNAYTSLIPGGLIKGWRGRKPVDPSGHMTRYIDVLMLTPVTVDICQGVVALQIANIVYKKIGQTPYDGSTPNQWIFEIEYSRDIPIIL